MHSDFSSLLNKKLQKIISRFPHFLNTSLFKEKDRVLACFNDNFIKKKSPAQLIRLIVSFYITKKELLHSVAHSPPMHHVKIRVIPTEVQYPFVSKSVVGILVQISLKNYYELFTQDHLFKSVQKLIPDLKIVKGSTCVFQDSDETTQTIYIECEKSHNQRMPLSEWGLLKKSLKEEVFSRIERVVPSVFMKRNQEELLKNILTLSREIERAGDLPEVMISLETQTTESFVFSILCVCSQNSLETIAQKKDPYFSWIVERKQLVKYVGRHQPIFAYVLQLLVSPNPSILRQDGSLNFLGVRRQIVHFLQNHIGEFRDFNGGILIKQQETFLALQQLFPSVSVEMMENILYAVTPIEMQIILPLTSLQFLVQKILQISEKKLSDTAHYILDSEKKEDYYFIGIRLVNGDFCEIAKKHLVSIEFPKTVVASLSIPATDSHIVGYILQTSENGEHHSFLQTLLEFLLESKKKIEKQQILSLIVENPIVSLDPRIGVDYMSSTFLKLLFEGVMRINKEGVLEMAIAEKIQTSSDKKIYTFSLRPSLWSDGTPLTSYDFEYAWKKILSPNFKTTNAIFFDVITNATLAKKGRVPMNEVGIYALNDSTLQIKLKYPNPYFLEYLALPFFAPICKNIDMNEPNWAHEGGNGYVCNGAFTVTKNNTTKFVFTKNENYWDKEEIHLDKILITSSPRSQIYNFFIQNKVHWLGGSISHWDNNFKPSPADQIVTYNDYGTYWCTCNTKHHLLKNKKIREAFHFALNRQKFLRNTEYFQKPAYSPLPALHSQYSCEEDPYNPKRAQELLQEGLEEEGVVYSAMENLSISYFNTCSYGKIVAEFLQEEWKEVLGINITLKGVDYITLFSTLENENFHFILSRWQPWVSDPMYTLGRFVCSKDPKNRSKWSYPPFKYLIKKAHQENNEKKRKQILIEAERILVREIPIIPLFQTQYQSIQKKSLLFTPNHMLLDFKWARLV